MSEADIRAAVGVAPELVEAGADELRLTRFSLFTAGGEELLFAVDTHDVHQVTEWEDLSPVPDAMAPVIGLYDFRGAPVPVIDVSLKLAAGRTKRCDRPRPRILIAEVERHLVGLLVPKTAPITFHPRSSLVQAPRELSRAAGAYLLGMLKGDTGRFVYVLDIDALVRSLGR